MMNYEPLIVAKNTAHLHQQPFNNFWEHESHSHNRHLSQLPISPAISAPPMVAPKLSRPGCTAALSPVTFASNATSTPARPVAMGQSHRARTPMGAHNQLAPAATPPPSSNTHPKHAAGTTSNTTSSLPLRTPENPPFPPAELASKVKACDLTDKALMACCAALELVENRALCPKEMGMLCWERGWLKGNDGNPAPARVIAEVLREHIRRSLLGPGYKSTSVPREEPYPSLLSTFNVAAAPTAWEHLAMGIDTSEKGPIRKGLVWYLSGDAGREDPFERSWAREIERLGPNTKSGKAGKRVRWNVSQDGKLEPVEYESPMGQPSMPDFRGRAPKKPSVRRETRSSAAAAAAATPPPPPPPEKSVVAEESCIQDIPSTPAHLQEFSSRSSSPSRPRFPAEDHLRRGTRLRQPSEAKLQAFATAGAHRSSTAGLGPAPDHVNECQSPVFSPTAVSSSSLASGILASDDGSISERPITDGSRATSPYDDSLGFCSTQNTNFPPGLKLKLKLGPSHSHANMHRGLDLADHLASPHEGEQKRKRGPGRPRKYEMAQNGEEFQGLPMCRSYSHSLSDAEYEDGDAGESMKRMKLSGNFGSSDSLDVSPFATRRGSLAASFSTLSSAASTSTHELRSDSPSLTSDISGLLCNFGFTVPMKMRSDSVTTTSSSLFGSWTSTRQSIPMDHEKLGTDEEDDSEESDYFHERLMDGKEFDAEDLDWGDLNMEDVTAIKTEEDCQSFFPPAHSRSQPVPNDLSWGFSNQGHQQMGRKGVGLRSTLACSANSRTEQSSSWLGQNKPTPSSKTPPTVTSSLPPSSMKQPATPLMLVSPHGFDLEFIGDDDNSVDHDDSLFDSFLDADDLHLSPNKIPTAQDEELDSTETFSSGQNTRHVSPEGSKDSSNSSWCEPSTLQSPRSRASSATSHFFKDVATPSTEKGFAFDDQRDGDVASSKCELDELSLAGELNEVSSEDLALISDPTAVPVEALDSAWPSVDEAPKPVAGANKTLESFLTTSNYVLSPTIASSPLLSPEFKRTGKDLASMWEERERGSIQSVQPAPTVSDELRVEDVTTAAEASLEHPPKPVLNAETIAGLQQFLTKAQPSPARPGTLAECPKPDASSAEPSRPRRSSRAAAIAATAVLKSS